MRAAQMRPTSFTRTPGEFELGQRKRCWEPRRRWHGDAIRDLELRLLTGQRADRDEVGRWTKWSK